MFEQQLMAGQRILVTGGGLANALAHGGNFHELHQWRDTDWNATRAGIEARNQKGKAQR